jgi:hypothetical protein
VNADLIWEPLTSTCSELNTNYPEEMTRAKVPGGWLVCGSIHHSPVMTFVPDQWFGWRLVGNNIPKT